MKIRVLSIGSGPLGPHASYVHEVSLVHGRCVRSQGSLPRSGAPATNFHPQWRAAGSWKLSGEVAYRIQHQGTKTPRDETQMSFDQSRGTFTTWPVTGLSPQATSTRMPGFRNSVLRM